MVEFLNQIETCVADAWRWDLLKCVYPPRLN